MLVRLLVSLSGTRNGQPWPRMGNEIDLPDEEARNMIAQLQAVPVTEHRKVETATAPAAAVETRVETRATERPLTTTTGIVPGKGKRGPR